VLQPAQPVQRHGGPVHGNLNGCVMVGSHESPSSLNLSETNSKIERFEDKTTS
jgi:hypothetical protein